MRVRTQRPPRRQLGEATASVKLWLTGYTQVACGEVWDFEVGRSNRSIRTVSAHGAVPAAAAADSGSISEEVVMAKRFRRRKTVSVFFGSDRLRGRRERNRVRRDLRRGAEPQPKYATRRFWVD